MSSELRILCDDVVSHSFGNLVEDGDSVLLQILTPLTCFLAVVSSDNQKIRVVVPQPRAPNCHQE